MSTIPAFTPCPGGFVTVQPLPDGQFLIESWWLNPVPFDSDQPRTEPVGHWIASGESDAIATITEFTADIARLAGDPASTTTA